MNATSLGGYFGEGTPCFLIRGTILSDVQVEGEYRTLDLVRPGNHIEIEDYDGAWATVTITTRRGNRAGDNITARMLLRDADLRQVGIDCETIIAGGGMVEAPEPPAPASALAPEPEPPPVAPAAEAPAAAPVEPPAPPPQRAKMFTTSATPAAGAKAARSGGKLFVEVGTSIVAIGLPVVLYFLRELLKNRKSEGGSS